MKHRGSYKEVIIFLAIVFFLTWLLWLLAFNFSSVFISIGVAIPSIVGIIMTYIYDGEIKSMFKIKSKLKWWIYSLCVMPVIAGISTFVLWLTGNGVPEPEFPLWFIPIAFFYILALMGPLGEEFGWRGFVFKRLLQKQNPFWAGLVLGIIWSAWHLPLFFINGTIQNQLTALGVATAILGYFVYTICISLLLTILYINTKGSVILCILFHTVSNLSLGVVPIILTKTGAMILISFVLVITIALVYYHRKDIIRQKQ